MSRTTIGLLVGLALGFAVIFANFGLMLVVALFGALGWGVAKVLDGDVDLSRYVGGRRDR